MTPETFLLIKLINGSQINIKNSDLVSVIINGIEMFDKTRTTINRTEKKPSQKTRLSRGEPIFYMLDHVMRMQYPNAIKNKETPVSKTEYDRIIHGLHAKFDPIGRVRWKTTSPKELGINASKIWAVRNLLIKTGVLKSGPKLRTSYGDKQTFIKKAQEVWEYLQRQEILKE